MKAGAKEEGAFSLIKEAKNPRSGKSGVSFRDSTGPIETQICELMRKEEGNNKGWMCLSCGKIDQKIKEHIEGHHIEIFEKVERFCNFCGQSFSLRSALQMHVSRKHRDLGLALSTKYEL